MKKKLVLVLVAVILVGGIVGAGSLYRQLSADYGNSSQLQDWTGGLGAQLPTNGSGGDGGQPEEGGDPVVPPVEGGEEEQIPEEGGDPVVPPIEGGNEEQIPEEGSDPVVPPVEGGNEEQIPEEGGDPVVPPVEGGNEEQIPEEGGDPVVPPVEEPEEPVVLQVPDFTVLDANGNYVKLSDLAGKPIVLNFWATWCYYCKAEMADFNRAYQEFPDVQFVMVNATDGVRETVASAKKYVADNGFGFDVFFDVNEEAVNAYGVTGFPTTFFISADGKPIARGVGMLDYATLLKGIGYIT